ncbi:MAG: cysteine desulfurase NifS [Phycisphaerae bacterium]|nr:cysteine desulfurase NifS [Phycisphaerae bacterium]
MVNVYLDNNATTAVAPEVVEAMMPFFQERYGNASSMHRFGSSVAHDIHQSREKVAALIGADPSEIVFTGCGTESDITAIRGTLARLPDKRHIVTTKVEHPAVRTTCRWLRGQGYHLTELGVDHKGRLDLDELRAAITDETAIVSVMWANNETGVIFPIQEIAELCHSRGVVFHSDAVQAAGKLRIDMSKTPVDLLAMSGHKLHSPKGIGVLYIRRGTKIAPLLMGGHQERGRRAGTENVPYIVGLGRACELALEHRDEENTRVKALRDRLERELLTRSSSSIVNGDTENRLPNTTNISFEYVEGEAILLLMDQVGIAASTGSACASGSLEPSHVLRAIGVPFTCVHGSIRFSLSRYTTDEEIDYTIEQLPRVIERLREISPYSADSPVPTEIHAGS